MSITPTNYDDFVQCERRFLNRHLLGLPASDPGAPNETGLLVHDMLRTIHAGGSCHDAAHVADVLAGPRRRRRPRPPARRAPRASAARPTAPAEAAARTSTTLARFHRLPQPMFMATARIDAIWVHDGLLDARDYKTGRLWHERVADVPAAKVQAFVLDEAARKRGLRLRLRYEYLSAEVDDDPDPWEPDPDDMAAIEEELRPRSSACAATTSGRASPTRRCARTARTARSAATAPRRASPRGRCSLPKPPDTAR